MIKPRWKIGVLAALATAAFLAGCGSNNSGPTGTGGGGGSVAVVNGQSIDREALRDHLEATNGESALRQLIDFALVTQKAKAEGIEISDAEVSAAIEQRSKNNSDISQVVQTGGVRLEALQRQTRYQLALDKLLTKDIKVTDDQLKKWFTSHSKYYDRPERVKIGFLLAATKVRADTMAAQLKSKAKSFQELVLEQQKANDRLGQGSQAESPQMVEVGTMPPAIKAALAKLKPGDTSSVLTIGQAPRQAFAIVRLVDRQPAVKADFVKMKDELTMDYKLEQVARQLNTQNPSNPPFERSLQQVEAILAQQSGGQRPDYRSILSFITQTGAQNLTSGLHTAAKVEIKDDAYVKVGESFKPVPGSESAPGAGGPAGAAPKK